MTRTVVVAAVLSVGLVACHHARGVGYVREDMPTGRPAFESGEPEAYWVWRDAAGWHVRTTSDEPRHFYGTVEIVSGTGGDVHGVGRAAGSVRRDGSTIRFDYRAAGGDQGFDWAGAGECNRFELYIDGTTRPLRVFLGTAEQSPARVPFAVCG